MDFDDEMTQRTSWWQNGGAGGSAGWIETRRDDALPGGSTAACEGQRDGFRRRDEPTHSLVAEWQRGRVSRMDPDDDTKRHTNWWQNGSMGGSAGWTETRRDDTHSTHGRVSQVLFGECSTKRTY